MLEPDFRDMLGALSSAGAEFLVVGAHAMAAHGVVRATGDLDIWVSPTPDNAQRVWQALQHFGAPLANLSPDDFAQRDQIIQFGVAPGRIDLLTGIDGVEFEAAFVNATQAHPDGVGPVAVLSRADLIRNKRATGREKDRVDADRLEAQ